jgi:hypothetical protein
MCHSLFDLLTILGIWKVRIRLLRPIKQNSQCLRNTINTSINPFLVLDQHLIGQKMI